MIAVIGAAKAAVTIKMSSTPNQGLDINMTYAETAADLPDDDIEVRYVGCGYNIAKHLAAMGYETAFISVVGRDPLGLASVADMKNAGIDVSGVSILPGCSPISVEMRNILGDTELLRSNDGLLMNVTPELIDKNAELLQSAQLIVLDGAIPQETLEYVAREYGGREDAKLFFDPASRAGGGKVKGILDRFYAVMPGRMEAEAMTDKAILSEDQLMEAGAYFAQRGISRTIITMKGGGIYYKEGINEGILRPQRVLSFADTSGAGDIVSAAVVAAAAEDKSIEESAQHAMAMAAEFLSKLTDERSI